MSASQNPKFRRLTALRKKFLLTYTHICGAAIFRARLAWLRSLNY